MNDPVTFKSSIKSFFKNYLNFSGRSTRAEYWFMLLLEIIILVFAGIILVATGLFTSKLSDTHFSGFQIAVIGIVLVAFVIWHLVTIIPYITLSVRRYRDAGINPWLYLPVLIVEMLDKGDSASKLANSHIGTSVTFLNISGVVSLVFSAIAIFDLYVCLRKSRPLQ